MFPRAVDNYVIVGVGEGFVVLVLDIVCFRIKV
jgi:hypothetical protein